MVGCITQYDSSIIFFFHLRYIIREAFVLTTTGIVQGEKGEGGAIEILTDKIKFILRKKKKNI